MDPPKRFEFHLDNNKLWWKLKLTFGVLLFNSLTALTIVAIAYYALGEVKLMSIVKSYTDDRKIYLSEFNLNNFLLVIRYCCVENPILEEYMFRYPFILLLINHLRVKLWYNLTNITIVILTLGMLTLWTADHGNIFVSIPLFISGIPLYWLAGKTRCLWPSITCHAASNFLLYILAQFLIYKGILEQIIP